jgi:hypothetical protein
MSMETYNDPKASPPEIDTTPVKKDNNKEK